MKPLTNEEKESVFDNIVKSIAYLHKPAPGEFTIQDLIDALDDAGHVITRGKIRYRIKKLVEMGLLDQRTIMSNATQTKVYIPIQNASYEELLELLLE